MYPLGGSGGSGGLRVPPFPSVHEAQLLRILRMVQPAIWNKISLENQVTCEFSRLSCDFQFQTANLFW